MGNAVIAMMLQKVDLMLGETPSDLNGRSRSVLIVEDDILLGMAIGLCVQDAGYEVAGLARSVDAALETLSHEIVDAALLDVNLQGELVFPVAKALTENSGREKTSAFCYAVGWTQHTVGVQYIRTAAIVQLLLGNIGRPGGGIVALRGHASIQGSTDLATLYNVLPGYLSMPHARQDPDLATKSGCSRASRRDPARYGYETAW